MGIFVIKLLSEKYMIKKIEMVITIYFKILTNLLIFPFSASIVKNSIA